jgi:hypothetical protein
MQHTPSHLFNLEKHIIFCFFFHVNVGRNFRIIGKLLFKISSYSHPEIWKFQGVTPTPDRAAPLQTPVKSTMSGVSEMNRISAKGNPTLCTSGIVPGSGYHVQSLSQVVQINTTRK